MSGGRRQIDTVETLSIDLTTRGLAGQEIENIVLTGNGNSIAIGNGLDNKLTGNAGNNALRWRRRRRHRRAGRDA